MPPCTAAAIGTTIVKDQRPQAPRRLTIRPATAAEIGLVRTKYAEWHYDGALGAQETILLAESADALLGMVRQTCEHGTVMLRGMQVDPASARHGDRNRLAAGVRGAPGRTGMLLPALFASDEFLWKTRIRALRAGGRPAVFAATAAAISCARPGCIDHAAPGASALKRTRPLRPNDKTRSIDQFRRNFLRNLTV